MGTQFALVYDIIILVVVAGMLFAGAKKGFAGMILGFVAVFVAFFCARTFSEPIADALYTSFVEEPLESAVDESLDKTMGAVALSGMSHIDYDKVMIDGVLVGEIKIDYSGTNKAIVELSDMDLSKTGIANVDLSLFGISSDTDFSSVNGRTAEFTMSDIEKYGLGKLAVAQYLAVNAQNSDFFDTFNVYTAEVGEALPTFLGSIADEILGGSVSALRKVIIMMSDGSATAKSAIINGIIEPNFKMAAQTIVFAVIFILVSVALGIIAAALKIVNKIPLLGSMNAFAGAVAGLLEGIITVFVICIAVRLIISLSGGNVMFFNEVTIDSTYIFKVFYNLDYLDFLA
jgi:hypothetical protein